MSEPTPQSKGWAAHMARELARVKQPIWERQGLSREEYDRLLGFTAEHPALVQRLVLALGVALEQEGESDA